MLAGSAKWESAGPGDRAHPFPTCFLIPGGIMGSCEALAHTSSILLFLQPCCISSPCLISLWGSAGSLQEQMWVLGLQLPESWAMLSCTKAQLCGGLDVAACSEFKMAGRYLCWTHVPCYTGWPKPADSFNLGSWWWLSTHCVCLLVWLSLKHIPFTPHGIAYSGSQTASATMRIMHPPSSPPPLAFFLSCCSLESIAEKFLRSESLAAAECQHPCLQEPQS